MDSKQLGLQPAHHPHSSSNQPKIPKNMSKSKEIGNIGEKIAENYLKDKGYQILDKNYSSKSSRGPLRGEVDIVAKKNDIISFIEVKTLQQIQGQPFSPEEKVGFGKQRKLVKTTESWLMKKKNPLNSKWQIDVIAIEVNSNKKSKINHFENAIPYC
jgi:putative endonuclease